MWINLFQKLKKFTDNIWFLWMSCLILNIITFFVIVFKIRPGGKTVALHYNVLVGVEWYGKGNNLYYLPLVGFLMLLVNFWLYRSLKKTNLFFPELTIFVSMAIELILLAAVIFLQTVN